MEDPSNCKHIMLLSLSHKLQNTQCSTMVPLSLSLSLSLCFKQILLPDLKLPNCISLYTMKSHPPKLKTTSHPLLSCFRLCTQTVISPTTSTPPLLPVSSSDPSPPPPPPVVPNPGKPSSSSSSSNSSTATSQSFTQWKFPIPHSPIPHHGQPLPEKPCLPLPPPLSSTDLQELYHVAELEFSSDPDPRGRIKTLTMLEKSLVLDPRVANVACPGAVMGAIVGLLGICAKPATKVLLALCLAEGNRRVAVDEGAAGRIVEALADLEGAAAERALAALELLCTVAEGAAEVRAHALAVPMMVEVMGRMAGRGKEYAISVLAVIYSGGDRGEGLHAPPEAVAGAVMLALQGDCSARGRRKGAQLLKILEENGRLGLNQEGA